MDGHLQETIPDPAWMCGRSWKTGAHRALLGPSLACGYQWPMMVRSSSWCHLSGGWRRRFLGSYASHVADPMREAALGIVQAALDSAVARRANQGALRPRVAHGALRHTAGHGARGVCGECSSVLHVMLFLENLIRALLIFNGGAKSPLPASLRWIALPIS
jgi:hypothetical protein